MIRGLVPSSPSLGTHRDTVLGTETARLKVEQIGFAVVKQM
jgi:hypothetical protein